MGERVVSGPNVTQPLFGSDEGDSGPIMMDRMATQSFTHPVTEGIRSYMYIYSSKTDGMTALTHVRGESDARRSLGVIIARRPELGIGAEQTDFLVDGKNGQ